MTGWDAMKTLSAECLEMAGQVKGENVAVSCAFLAIAARINELMHEGVGAKVRIKNVRQMQRYN